METSIDTDFPDRGGFVGRHNRDGRPTITDQQGRVVALLASDKSAIAQTSRRSWVVQIERGWRGWAITLTDQSTGRLSARVRPRWLPLRYRVAIGSRRCELKKRPFKNDWALTDDHGQTLVRVADHDDGIEVVVERSHTGQPAALLAIIAAQTVRIDSQIPKIADGSAVGG